MASLLRLHVPQLQLQPLALAALVDLPLEAVRHAQVRRLQPGDSLHLFDGQGHEWQAELLQMGRQNARVRLTAEVAALPELPWQVTLAIGVPANERMDTLVEKATELGVARLQPLQAERSVLRLSGERAQRRCAHWQAIAVAACEQSGRARVPPVAPLLTLPAWLAALPTAAESPDGAASHRRWVLTPEDGVSPSTLSDLPGAGGTLLALSGPEGGLSEAELDLARQRGFVPLHLGPRVLRADTAPLALMAWMSLLP